MPSRAHDTTEVPSGMERIVFFSDAVMAITITLLVLDIRLPEATGLVGPTLASQVLALAAKYLGYAVSFWVIALYWVAHLRCFRYIRRYDRRLIYLNFLFLMFIAFMPFPTSLLFTTASSLISVLFYAGTAAGMGLSLAALWVYAGRHKFIVNTISARIVLEIRRNLVYPPLVFLLSMGIAFINANAAVFSWLLLLPVYALLRHSEAPVMSDVLG